MSYPHPVSFYTTFSLAHYTPATLTFPLFLRHTKLQAHFQLRAFAIAAVPSASRASHDWLFLVIHVSAQMSYTLSCLPWPSYLISPHPRYHITLPYFLHNTFHHVKLSWSLIYELLTVYLPQLEHKHHGILSHVYHST